jgi:uncharacterized protein (DUF169 family)
VDKNKIRELALSLEKSTGLASMPVGVKFVFDKINDGYKAEKLSGYRYCQALMQARHGKHVTLDAAGIACPAAAAAFGYKPLPEALKSGKGLVGFGITVDEETGKRMFEEMTVLEQGKLKDLYLFPLETAEIEPDIVVVEDEVEKLMWIVLSELNRKQGGRIESNTAVLQATCVDTALVPFVNQKFNMSFGCYGCRDATDIGPNETVIGFPFKDFEKINGYAARLAEKAVANSRAKNAYALLRKKAAEKTVKEDPFQAE